mmetsp:Transcript_21707/g.31974  ORF Transcript_21707/g.31974 Transcript_21707/m.31974 type:complete len:85 (-) Transcript_21707:9-263(-)
MVFEFVDSCRRKKSRCKPGSVRPHFEWVVVVDEMCDVNDGGIAPHASQPQRIPTQTASKNNSGRLGPMLFILDAIPATKDIFVD